MKARKKSRMRDQENIKRVRRRRKTLEDRDKEEYKTQNEEHRRVKKETRDRESLFPLTPSDIKVIVHADSVISL